MADVVDLTKYRRKEPYQAEREADRAATDHLLSAAFSVSALVRHLERQGYSSRSTQRALLHLEDAAMWLRRAHYQKD